MAKVTYAMAHIWNLMYMYTFCVVKYNINKSNTGKHWNSSTLLKISEDVIPSIVFNTLKQMAGILQSYLHYVSTQWLDWPTCVVEGCLWRLKILWLMYSILPYKAHLAASRDFSPQLTPSAINMIQLFPLAQMAKASATGSPEEYTRLTFNKRLNKWEILRFSLVHIYHTVSISTST